MSRFFQNHAAGGFRVDSPVKKPGASEMPRCAPPHTFRAGEEPLGGGEHGDTAKASGTLVNFAFSEFQEATACLQRSMLVVRNTITLDRGEL